MRSCILCATILIALPVGSTSGHEDEDPAPVRLSPLVQRLLDDPIATNEQRTRLRVFHGQWEQIESLPAEEQAAFDLLRYDVGSALISDESIDRLVRATAALRIGQPEKTIVPARKQIVARSSQGRRQ